MKRQVWKQSGDGRPDCVWWHLDNVSKPRHVTVKFAPAEFARICGSYIRIYIYICIRVICTRYTVAPLPNDFWETNLFREEGNAWFRPIDASFEEFMGCFTSLAVARFEHVFANGWWKDQIPRVKKIIKRRRCYLNCSFFLSLSIDSSYHLFPFLVIQIAFFLLLRILKRILNLIFLNFYN